MLIDCDACAVRGPACRDCVVSVMLGAPSVRHHSPTSAPAPGTRHSHPPCSTAGPSPCTGIDLDQHEQAAIAVLAGSGLVPPLRLVARPLDPDEAGTLNWDHEPDDAAHADHRRSNRVSSNDHRAAG